MSIKFKTQYNMKPEDYVKPRKITGVSKTIPEQSFTLREIIDRYSRGLPLPGAVGQPIYEGEEGLPFDPRVLDLSELHNMAKTSSEAIREAENEKMEKDKAEKKKAFKEALKREIEEEAKKQGEIPA